MNEIDKALYAYLFVYYNNINTANLFAYTVKYHILLHD